MFKSSPELFIDGYKCDHRRQYPDGTEFIYSNFTPRSSRIPGVDKVVFFGLQAALIKLAEEWDRNFFQQPKELVLERYQKTMNGYLPDNNMTFDHIGELHDYGNLPIMVRALKEGTRVPLRIPMFTVINTDKRFGWITNYFETILSAEVWKTCTNATLAYEFRKLLMKYAIETGDENFVDWQGHDFSFRGMDGVDSAKRSGAAHLLSFYGTDTLPALEWIEQYYNPLCQDGNVIAGSVAATEHSVVSAGGSDNELGTFKRLLDLYPTGIISAVSDTWDLWNVLTNILPTLKRDIMGRNGKLTIRPDSGDPRDIICGINTKSKVNGQFKYLTDALVNTSPSDKGVVELLWDVFGGTINAKGYKVLDPHIGAIYGDSITLERAAEICERLKCKGFASTNVVLGIGSFTYQYNTRDTFGFAMKATKAVIKGKEYDLFKKPITDNGEKFSATGWLAVLKDENSELYLKEKATLQETNSDCMNRIYYEGLKDLDSFADIRSRLHNS